MVSPLSSESALELTVPAKTLQTLERPPVFWEMSNVEAGSSGGVGLNDACSGSAGEELPMRGRRSSTFTVRHTTFSSRYFSEHVQVKVKGQDFSHESGMNSHRPYTKT